jgi:hypothetical protein
VGVVQNLNEIVVAEKSLNNFFTFFMHAKLLLIINLKTNPFSKEAPV